MRGLAALLVLPLATGCISSYESKPVREVHLEPGVTTKEDVIKMLGTPSGMRRQGEDVVLVFSHGLEQGRSYGLGTLAISLLAESTHKGVDFLEVVIAPDRKVRSYRLASRERETPAWPSDD